ncbi:MAG: beta-galactosidase [Clostridia bacterium]|nr:beta-galactosidase [Clostridia bacterium]
MIYRAEHPKPQFMRQNWQNLNGIWQFEPDNANSGEARGLWQENQTFSLSIQVPFCPESKLSGIENVDFMNAVWYKRTVGITESQLQGNVILHFGAVDYKATVYVNGQVCGTHRGGYVSFSFNITKFLRSGKNTITLHAEDDTRDPLIPSGKQSSKYHSYGCYYTRTTGIWQTVWLEFVPKDYIISAKYYTDPAHGILDIDARLCGSGCLQAEAFYQGRSMGKAECRSNGGRTLLHLPLAETHLWEVGNGRLYDLILTFNDDRVESYFGLRSLRLDGYRFLINEKPVFQRLVLDQGFYPDGIYTAPSDEALRNDIVSSMAMGFNGARLHEKVFEERFLYHCDRMGYIVWGEYPNWGLDHTRSDSIFSILPEWLEELERDFNHPAIIGWCPFNETWDINNRKQQDDVLRSIYLATKAADPTRPCIDTSGNFHVCTDIFDVHDYNQDPTTFRKTYSDLPLNGTFVDVVTTIPKRAARYQNRHHYQSGQPMFVSEYGGIAWNTEKEGWGYGNAPKTEQEFLERLKGLTDALLENPCMLGLCYTQLTDVEQEQNGLYTYDRKPKFDPTIIHSIFSKKAAIEESP